MTDRTLTLPLHKLVILAAVEESVAHEDGAPMTQPLQVLIVEDTASDARLVVRHIEDSGYRLSWKRVDSAATLKDALNRMPVDLVLCDYSMPGFSGTDALAIVRESGRDVPFIFVSGTLGEDVAVESMKAGAQDYVVKGNLKRLVPAIERELREVTVRRGRREAEQMLALRTSDLETANQKLRIALAAVKELTGLLPICGYCKKIRDASDYWQRLEDYLQQNSKARLSHGICPDCLPKLMAQAEN